MIVTTPEGIVPLRDKHKSPMSFSRYEGGSFGMNAFSCTQAGCNGVYNTSGRYLDVVNGQILLQREERLCPEDGTAMFLEWLAQSDDGITEMWRCVQKNCCRVVAVKP